MVRNIAEISPIVFVCWGILILLMLTAMFSFFINLPSKLRDWYQLLIQHGQMLVNKCRFKLPYFKKMTIWKSMLIVLVYFLFLTSLIFVFYQLFRNVPLLETRLFDNFYGFFRRALTHSMDSVHYVNIVHFGYSYPPKTIVFFPLYPFIFWIANSFLHNLTLTTLCLNFVFLSLALYYLFVMIEHDFSTRVAKLTIAFLLLFPVSFFSFLLYTESLFLLLTVLCFYFLQKKHWRGAGIVGFLAALTRSQGFLLSLPMLIELYQNYGLIKKDWKKYLFALLPPMGLIVYLCLNKMITGDFFSFLFYQQNEWAQSSQSFVITLFKQMAIIQFSNFMYNFTRWIPQVVALIIAACLIIYANLKKINLKYTLYAMVYIVFSFSITNPMSGMRFLFVLWPLSLIAAKFFEHKSSIWKAGVCFFELTLLIIFWLVFLLFYTIC